MDEPITITITGPRGIGKTTTAMAIVWLLRSLGQCVKYEADTHHQEKLADGDLSCVDVLLTAKDVLFTAERRVNNIIVRDATPAD